MTKMEDMRGSERVLAAWKTRALTDEGVKAIADGLSKSRGKIEAVEVGGGSAPTGMRVAISYSGDDVSWCGNDMTFWLNWLRKYGGVVAERPKIIINGKPWPDLVRVEFDFGRVGSIVDQIDPGRIEGIGGNAGF